MDRSYEIEVEITLSEESVGGLILFYSEKAFSGIVSDGKQFTIYKSAVEMIQQLSIFSDHFFLKITNRQNLCDLQASKDGKAWATIQASVEVSQMHHNRFGGFFALRPGLMAAGDGRVKFEHLQYHVIQ